MQNRPKDGALNLLKNCLNVHKGDSVLLVLEPTNTFYDSSVATLIQESLVHLSTRVTVMNPQLICDPNDFPDDVASAMKEHDHTLFLSRIGDYVRFTPLSSNSTPATSYARNTELLGAPYATIDNRLMKTLQLKLEDELMRAHRWRIQCPLGTDLTGTFCWSSLVGGQDDELSVILFPVATYKPVPCNDASGQVALSRWLMPGGAAKLDDAEMTIRGIVYAQVEDGHIQSFNGANSEVLKINNHYDYVSKTLGINRNRVHSWHAGINPQTRFDHPADDFLDLWSAISFGSPKYLHFHTSHYHNRRH